MNRKQKLKLGLVDKLVSLLKEEEYIFFEERPFLTKRNKDSNIIEQKDKREDIEFQIKDISKKIEEL